MTAQRHPLLLACKKKTGRTRRRGARGDGCAEKIFARSTPQRAIVLSSFFILSILSILSKFRLQCSHSSSASGETGLPVNHCPSRLSNMMRRQASS